MYSLTAEYLAQLHFNSAELNALQALNQYRHVEMVKIAQERAAPTLPSKSPKHSLKNELLGYQNALTWIHQSPHEIPFSIDTILQLHKLIGISIECPGGFFRTANNRVNAEHSDGSIEVVFKPPAFSLVPKLMENLVQLYHAAIASQQAEPLVIIPLTVFDFFTIHPFMDGNGRVGRLLTILLLYQTGFSIVHDVAFDRILDNSRASSADALAISRDGWSDGKHNAKPWLKYFWGALGYAHASYMLNN